VDVVQVGQKYSNDELKMVLDLKNVAHYSNSEKKRRAKKKVTKRVGRRLRPGR
jgi:hypothetical protein